MEKIDWKRKLTSRKFWAAVVGVMTAIMIFFKVPESEITQVSAIITNGGVLISYIISEGMADAAAVKNAIDSENKQ